MFTPDHRGSTLLGVRVKPLHVGKVGGSLFNCPSLPSRLRAWIDGRPHERFLFVPGGGIAADLIRQAQAVHGLADEKAHWLAVRAMSLTAHLLGGLLDLPVVTEPGAGHAVLDVHPFLMTDDRLGQTWDVTSDSIAARVAQVHGGRLTLFKSVDLPEGMSWAQAAEAGLVDPMFPTIAERVDVSWINLRAR
jgi:aspartokinase-like uncharacterized kinase